MSAALAYALRRSSARVVIAVGLGGLFWAVYRALPFVPTPGRFMKPSISFDPTRLPGASPSDVALAGLIAAGAVVVAAVLYRERSTSR